MRHIKRNAEIEIARGNTPGASVFGGLGERESMAVVVTGEDIWRGNELTPAPTSHTTIPTPSALGEQMTVVSENANDTSAGTGVRTLEIHFIDEAGNAQVETVTMNGTTPVNTVSTKIRFVNHMNTKTVGTNTVAAGHIKIYKTGSVGLVYSMIAKGGNMSLVSNRMVPRGHTLILTGWHGTEAQGKRVALRVRSTDMDGVLLPGVFTFKDTVYLNKTSSGHMDDAIKIPAFSIVKISGWGDATGAEVSVAWSGILFED